MLVASLLIIGVSDEPESEPVTTLAALSSTGAMWAVTLRGGSGYRTHGT